MGVRDGSDARECVVVGDNVGFRGVYRLSVQEQPAPVAAWPERRFNSFTAADHVRDFFAQQGLGAVNEVNHYLPG